MGDIDVPVVCLRCSVEVRLKEVLDREEDVDALDIEGGGLSRRFLSLVTGSRCLDGVVVGCG